MRFILAISLFCSIYIYGQEPSYFIVGAEELASVHIYDLGQDQKGSYFLATNKGLYRFDGYQFVKLKSKKMFSESLFNITIDEKDNVFCHNLSGQIFKVKEDSCKLYYQIPDSLLREQTSIHTNADGLLVQGKKMFIVKEDKTIKVLDDQAREGASFGGGIFDFGENKELVFDYANHAFYLISHDSLWFYSSTPEDIWPAFFELNGETVGFDLTTRSLIYKDDSVAVFHEASRRDRNRIYCDGENIWAGGLKGGVTVTKGIDQPLFNGNTILSNYFISALMRDSEGNIVLGTFGEGLIVIPNIAATTYHLPDVNDKPTKLVTDEKGQLFIGSLKGKLYKLSTEGELSLYEHQNSKFIEFMDYFPESGELLVDDKIPHFINLRTGTTTDIDLGAIKNVKQISGNRYLIASNVGVRWIDLHTKERTLISGFEHRTNAVEYNSKTNKIYAGTSQGLLIGNENESEFFQLSDKQVLAKYIINVNDTILICTQSEGVLKFVDDSLYEHWTTKNGMPSNQVNKIIPYKSKYVLSTDNGVSIVNHEGKTINWIRKPEGISSNRVTDIALNEDFLYVTHTTEIQQIDLKSLPLMDEVPTVKLARLEVNDVEQKDWNSKQEYGYDENKFAFQFSANTIKFSTELYYEYKLEGIDEEWQRNTFEDNLVTYKSLPSGDYRFVYRSVCRGETSALQEYTFSVATPYWRAVWFWLLMVLLFLVLTYSIYRTQSKRQQKMAENQRELIRSKLTALQSQMNPHFIFNSLNSIQDLVLRQDEENAYNYISKFAFLVRKVLSFSQVEFVDIEEETEVLKVYLDLEELRFKKDFTYELSAEDLDDVMIPPMIIQPFVENALKHGLLHKKGEKQLRILLFLEGESLKCIIEDNGVGRERSREINARKRTHESFSVKSIRSRFDILKTKFGGELGVEFEDLMEGDKPLGTRVILRIPVKRKY